MKTKRTICAITGTRADFGLLRWTLDGVRHHPELELRLLATGAHLDSAYGDTLAEITGAGFDIDASVPLGAIGGSATRVSHALGRAVTGIADALDRLQPDAVLILGDRYEILAAAQAAMLAGIPICHLHGGEATEGLVDEAIRHAITKMAHIHCVAAPAYARRVRQLGESPAQVHVVGATGLDAIERLPLLDRSALESDLGYRVGSRHLLLTYHPVTLLQEDTGAALTPLISALETMDRCTVTITGANADAGGEALNERLAAFAADHENVHFTMSLGQLRYLSLARASAAVIGNSSSGLIEVPSLGVPTVNIGDRQRNRLRGPSVIDCENDAERITHAIHRALGDDMRRIAARCENPYGTPGAAHRIVDILASTPLDGILLKHFHDWPEP